MPLTQIKFRHEFPQNIEIDAVTTARLQPGHKRQEKLGFSPCVTTSISHPQMGGSSSLTNYADFRFADFAGAFTIPIPFAGGSFTLFTGFFAAAGRASLPILFRSASIKFTTLLGRCFGPSSIGTGALLTFASTSAFTAVS
jgi:hypothetical protein